MQIKKSTRKAKEQGKKEGGVLPVLKMPVKNPGEKTKTRGPKEEKKTKQQQEQGKDLNGAEPNSTGTSKKGKLKIFESQKKVCNSYTKKKKKGDKER